VTTPTSALRGAYLRADRRTLVIAEPESPDGPEPGDPTSATIETATIKVTMVSDPTIIVEPSPDTPLVWFEIAIRGGAARDPHGVEGLHAMPRCLPAAAPAVATARSSTTRSTASARRRYHGVARCGVAVGLALTRHLDAVIELAATCSRCRSSRPTSTPALRETPQVLDEIRDDEARWPPGGSTGCAAPATPTDGRRWAPRRRWRGSSSPRRPDVAPRGRRRQPGDRPCRRRQRGQRPAHRHAADRRLPTTPPAPSCATARPPATGRRVILVDKPDRTQAQLRIGHLAARYGGPDTAELALAEAVLGACSARG